LPTLWLRNTWAWGYPDETSQPIRLHGDRLISPPLGELEPYELLLRGQGRWLFTDNETNSERLYGQPNRTPFQKDGFHRFLIDGEHGAINPAGEGTKAAALLQHTLEPCETWTVELRLRALAETAQDDSGTGTATAAAAPFGDAFNALFEAREQEWQAYMEQRLPGLAPDDRLIHNTALAGLLWCKKYYGWSVQRWLEGDPTQPAPPAQRLHSETAEWQRLHAHDIIAMPDAWEYPYFCQWDLMFHAVSFAILDPAMVKQQSMLLRSTHYTAPNAQTPAYEWVLSDPNPPIGGWAVMGIFQIERKQAESTADFAYLRAALRKLLLEYGWWANRNDRSGDNVFVGGFLGLGNIAVFDRRFPRAALR